MIDIHAHILPGLDDGASDIYDTLEMVKMAADSGVRAIVATPHCNVPGMYENYYDEEYADVFRYVRRAVKEERIPVQILPGMEVYATYDLPKRIEERKIMSLNQSAYMLMEFPFEAEADFADAILKKLRSMGVRPVVAHAERYEFVQDDPQTVYEWRKNGVLVQVNKGSFLGRFGRHARKTAYQLLDHNLVSVVASDAHSPFKRTPYMMDAYEELSGQYPEEYLRILFKENPRRICENRPTIRFELRPFEDDWLE